MTGAEFLHQLTAADFSLAKDRLSVLLFRGEEEYWAIRSLQLIKKRLFPEGEGEFNLMELDAGSLSPGEITVALSTTPFFSPTRLVVLRRLEKMKAAFDDDLLRGLSSMASGVILVVMAVSTDRRRKAIKELVNRAMVIDCQPFKPYQARKWVMEEARRMRVPVSTTIAELLVELRGTSPAMLRKELEKALLYQGGEKKTLTREEWIRLIGGSTEDNVFALIDRISQGDLGAALRELDLLFSSGESEFMLLFMFARQIRELFRARVFIDQGKGSAALQKELNCHPYVAEKLITQARGVSYSRLRAAHRRILRADYRLKSGVSASRLELEMVVMDLTSKVGGVYNSKE